MARSDAPGADGRPARRWSRRAFLVGCAAGGATLLTGAGAYGYGVETEWLQVERVTLSLPRLPLWFDGLTVVQLSDFHFGPDVNPLHIRRAVDVTLGLGPDLIVLTGDFVSRLSAAEPVHITRELGRLTAPEGVWAVLGNHDNHLSARVVTQALTGAGARVLRNASTVLRRADERLWLAGVDDILEQKGDLDAALRGIPDSGPTIVLVHEPDFADRVAGDPRVCLQLSGHSHGGQVRCPLLGPPLLPWLAEKYPQGLYRIGDLRLYTNRGLGTIGVPIRINCRPEVTLLTLKVPTDRESQA